MENENIDEVIEKAKNQRRQRPFEQRVGLLKAEDALKQLGGEDDYEQSLLAIVTSVPRWDSPESGAGIPTRIQRTGCGQGEPEVERVDRGRDRQTQPGTQAGEARAQRQVGWGRSWRAAAPGTGGEESDHEDRQGQGGVQQELKNLTATAYRSNPCGRCWQTKSFTQLYPRLHEDFQRHFATTNHGQVLDKFVPWTDRTASTKLSGCHLDPLIYAGRRLQSFRPFCFPFLLRWWDGSNQHYEQQIFPPRIPREPR